MDMFCYQCEQAAKGTGCTRVGVCGKDPETAALQDMLIEVSKGLAHWGHRARALGRKHQAADRYLLEALFSTVTNVNFDPDRLWDKLQQGLALREEVRGLYEEACREAGRQPETLDGAAAWRPAADRGQAAAAAGDLSISARRNTLGEDVVGLQELLLYGLKGVAAYADHALLLGKEDEEVYAFFHEVLDALTREDLGAEDLLGLVLRCGEVNLSVMKMLDAAHTGTFGNPEPTAVRISPVKGKAILVSGHDLKDLHALLQQTEGTGIQVYTHGEMLPAHGYPGLKKYSHLAGNYGGAWQDQQREFEAFPGSILMTTNCIQKPRSGYLNRIFTGGLVAWPGVQHLSGHDYRPLMDAAQRAPGFEADAPEKTIMVGFGHHAVGQAAGDVVAAVQRGDIRHFFLIGGCDGAKPGRNYFTELAEQVPEDCMILTLACGKYRFNKLDFGQVAGLPRLLDVGQCNDAYSAIQIAVALATAFKVGVNELPLSLILSWYEQKAVCVLLSLLHLGIQGIRLGPTLPAFVTPAMLKILQDKFDIQPITTPEQDLATILG